MCLRIYKMVSSQDLSFYRKPPAIDLIMTSTMILDSFWKRRLLTRSLLVIPVASAGSFLKVIFRASILV